MNKIDIRYQVAFLFPASSSEKVSAEMLNCKGEQTRGFWALIPLKEIIFKFWCELMGHLQKVEQGMESSIPSRKMSRL